LAAKITMLARHGKRLRLPINALEVTVVSQKRNPTSVCVILDFVMLLR